MKGEVEREEGEKLLTQSFRKTLESPHLFWLLVLLRNFLLVAFFFFFCSFLLVFFVSLLSVLFFSVSFPPLMLVWISHIGVCYLIQIGCCQPQPAYERDWPRIGHT
jgi:hypothetical protein